MSIFGYNRESKCIIKATVQHTQYFWGDVSEIEGQTLPLIERNQEGACLCLVPGKGLVDIDPRDVKEIIQPFDPDSIINMLFNSII